MRTPGALPEAAPVGGCVVVVMLAGLGMATFLAGADWGMPGYRTADDWVMRVGWAPFTPIFNTFVFPMLILIVLGAWIGRRRLLDDAVEHRPALRRLALGGVAISVLGGLPRALAGAGVPDVGDSAYGLLLGVQILTGICGGVGYAAGFAIVGARLERRRGPVTRTLAAAGRRGPADALLRRLVYGRPS